MSVFIGYPSFMAYQMMKGKKDNNEGFPTIPGTIARYSALGLTNEEMSKNPVWVDKTGNDHDLQMKNFAWKGMSGIGGVSTYYDKYEFTPDKYYMVAVSSGTQHAQLTFKVTGLVDGNILSLADTSSPSNVYGKWTQDGIYTVDIDVINTDRSLYFYNGVSATRGEFTIEILPLYPGALVFDGVDDYGTCDNFPILTKEKGYTVVALRQWITYNPNAISAIATNASDQSFNGAFTFENYNKGAEQTISYGATQISLQYSKSPFSWQTTSKYNGVNIANGNKDATNSLVLGRSYPQRNDFANFAIWELVFLDHDATEEELTKIKDYFVKTYPWLFSDQAWTVTGKTNEDEDRATIANITGNGNNLVLSNFGFAEGSGYNEEGEYAGYLVTDGVDDKVVSAESIAFTDTWTIITDTVFLGKVSVASGILASNIFTVYNYQGSGTIAVAMGDGGSSLRVITSSIKAFSSDGTIYDAEWNEYHVKIGTIRALERLLKIGTSSNETSYFCQLAFKFLGIYNNQILSKDDCIKAYNYLQTLKAK